MLEVKQTLDLLGDVLIVQSRELSPREVWWQLTQPARAVPAPSPGRVWEMKPDCALISSILPVLCLILSECYPTRMGLSKIPLISPLSSSGDTPGLGKDGNGWRSLVSQAKRTAFHSLRKCGSPRGKAAEVGRLGRKGVEDRSLAVGSTSGYRWLDASPRLCPARGRPPRTGPA